MNVKKSDKHRDDIQMYLSEKEEWISSVPVVTGVAVSYAKQRQVDEPSTGQRKEERLATDLMEAVISLPNLEKACRRVISNNGSAGIDGMTVKELGEWFSKKLAVLTNGTIVRQLHALCGKRVGNTER